MSRALALGLALLTLLPAGASAATVANHGLRTLGLEPPEAKALDAVLAAALDETPGISPVAASPAAAACRADAVCHCRAARAERAAKAIYGNVGRIDRLHTFELVVVDAQGCQVESSTFVGEELEDAAVPGRLQALLRQLLIPREAVSQTAAKGERGVADVPAMVTVVTARQIQELGLTRIDEVFRLVPGFEVLDTSWGRRVLHYGLSGTLLLMIDGVPVNDPVDTFADLGVSFDLSLDQIERIEFVRGPGSVLWGADAFLGIVNFITRTPTRETPQATAQARYGTNGTYDLHAAVEQATPAFAYRLGATLHSAAGSAVRVDDSLWARTDVPEPVWGNSGFTTPRASPYVDVVGRLTVGHLTLRFDFVRYTTIFQISPSGALLDPARPGSWQRQLAILAADWEVELGAGVRLRLSASRFEKTFFEDFVLWPAHAETLPDGLRFRQGNLAEPMVNYLSEARLEWKAAAGPFVNRLLGGVALLNQRIPDTFTTAAGLSSQEPPLDLDFRAASLTTLGLYLVDELSLGERWAASAGVRFEYRGTFPSVLNKQAALLRRSERLDAKLVYSEGFRPPNANDLFSTVGTQANTALRPERTRALLLEGDLQLVGPLRFGAGGGWVRVLDLIVADPDPAVIRSINSDSTIDIFSTFAELRLRHPALEAFASWGYKRLVFQPAADRSLAVAPHTGSAGAIFRAVKDLTASVTLAVVGPRPVQQRVAPGDTLVDRTLPPALYLGVGAGVRNVFTEGLSFDLHLDNPLGLVHWVPYAVAGPTSLVERREARELLLTVRFSN